MKFRPLFEAATEIFFTDDFDSIQDLQDYISSKYKNSKEIELYVGRGDTIAHGIKVTGKALKDKKLMDQVLSLECDEEDPMDCY